MEPPSESHVEPYASAAHLLDVGPEKVRPTLGRTKRRCPGRRQLSCLLEEAFLVDCEALTVFHPDLAVHHDLADRPPVLPIHQVPGQRHHGTPLPRREGDSHTGGRGALATEPS